MNRVWVVKAAGHNFEAAERFGEVHVIVPEDVSPFNVDQQLAAIEKALADSSAEDYLLFSGPPITNSLALLYWILKHKTASVLLFRPSTGEYIFRRIML